MARLDDVFVAYVDERDFQAKEKEIDVISIDSE